MYAPSHYSGGMFLSNVEMKSVVLAFEMKWVIPSWFPNAVIRYQPFRFEDLTDYIEDSSNQIQMISPTWPKRNVF